MPSQQATAMVKFKVLPGNEASFLEAQNEVGNRVSHVPGFISRQVNNPTAPNTDEWMVLYRFENRQHMADWFESAERQELMRRFDNLLAEPSRVHVVEHSDAVDAVCVVLAHHVKPGCEGAFQHWHQTIVKVQRDMGLLVKEELYPPVPGLNPEWVTILSFKDRQSVDRWLNCPEREKLLEDLKPLVNDYTIEHIGTGLEGWFDLGGETSVEIPAWKQVLTVLFALYPTVMLLTLYVTPVFHRLSMNWVMLIGNLMSVSILTYFLMRFVSRAFQWWTNPKVPSAKTDALGAAVIIGLLLIMAAGFGYLLPA